VLLLRRFLFDVFPESNLQFVQRGGKDTQGGEESFNLFECTN